MFIHISKSEQIYISKDHRITESQILHETRLWFSLKDFGVSVILNAQFIKTLYLLSTVIFIKYTFLKNIKKYYVTSVWQNALLCNLLPMKYYSKILLASE